MKYLVVISLTVLLSACSKQIAFGDCDYRVRTGECARHAFHPKDIDMVATNYEATDKLIVNAKQNIDDKQRILVTTIADINNLNDSAPLGRLVGEQIASRMIERGFKVVEVRLQDSVSLVPYTGEFILSRGVRELREIGRAQTVSRIVTGTYTVAEETIFITLKILDFWDSKAVASHTYTLPMTKDIDQLLKKTRAWWWL
ncbi:FlgO family outer membrane protein [Candidatus Albibeggiatoa sp. nov. NOAA]|uniref:FlgO family outer membrane protein n=1 Tax=Candidatus Albibeggiatoa sp. nov. NOAA TaxID=3162724 RepID=UPI0032FCA915|nr:FlgO family outer membrane protein [Thiotrichaceae bacterium]